MNKGVLNFYGSTDMGRQRTNNEDAFVVEKMDENTVLAIAIDGVGGYEGGEVAAEIAQNEIPAYLKEYSRGERLELLKQAITAANNAIFERRQADASVPNMSCVLTSAIIDMERKVVDMVHVGDTRMYQFHHGKLKKLSHDHSLIGYREEVGDLTEEEAMHHPQRNVISRDVGSEKHEIADPDFIEAEVFPLLPNSTFLLCSDGLTDLITSKQIVAILEQEISLEEKAQALIATANEAGGKDNVTVVLVEYQAEEPDTTKEMENEKANIIMPPTTDQHPTIEEHQPSTVKPTTQQSIWKRFWQNRRKILAYIVLISISLSVSLFLLLSSNYMSDNAVISDDLMWNILMVFCCFGGLCSLWLIVHELKAIVKRQKKSKLFWAIAIFNVLLIILFLFNQLREFQGTDNISAVVLFFVIVFVIALCIEIIMYVIIPIVKFKSYGFTLKQRLITYGKIMFYVATYILSVAYICCFICYFLDSLFAHLYFERGGNEYDFVWEESENLFYSSVAFSVLVAIVLGTYTMNIFKIEIEKRIENESK